MGIKQRSVSLRMFTVAFHAFLGKVKVRKGERVAHIGRKWTPQGYSHPGLSMRMHM